MPLDPALSLTGAAYRVLYSTVNLTPAAFFAAPLNSIPGMADALYAFMGTPSTGFDRPIFLGVGRFDRDVPSAPHFVTKRHPPSGAVALVRCGR